MLSYENLFYSKYLKVNIILFTAPPKWIREPVDIITKIGESINIHCDAIGSPKPKIAWRKFTSKFI